MHLSHSNSQIYFHSGGITKLLTAVPQLVLGLSQKLCCFLYNLGWGKKAKQPEVTLWINLYGLFSVTEQRMPAGFNSVSWAAALLLAGLNLFPTD